MPVREINIIEIAQRVFDKTVEIMPKTTTNLANILIDKAQELWQLKAKNTPTKKDGYPSLWGERYASAIKVDYATTGSGRARVYADESDPNYMFVNIVENGITQWSIKDALLAGKAARRNKAIHGTAFVHVPFRYRIPGVTRETSSFAGIMPVDIYEKAKAGIRLGQESGKYMGLVKYSSGVHSQYLTFRTVSQKSKGWIYPNRPSTPIFSEITQKVEKMFEDTILKFLKGYMKDIVTESKK